MVAKEMGKDRKRGFIGKSFYQCGDQKSEDDPA